MPPQPLVVGGKAHGHVAADIDRNGGDIAGRVREQPPEFRHGRGQLVLLEERHAVLRRQYAARVHAAPAAGIKLLAEQDFSRPHRIGGIDNNDIEAAVGLGDVFCAVVDDGFEAFIGKDRVR